MKRRSVSCDGRFRAMVRGRGGSARPSIGRWGWFRRAILIMRWNPTWDTICGHWTWPCRVTLAMGHASGLSCGPQGRFMYGKVPFLRPGVPQTVVEWAGFGRARPRARLRLSPSISHLHFLLCRSALSTFACPRQVKRIERRCAFRDEMTHRFRGLSR